MNLVRSMVLVPLFLAAGLSTAHASLPCAALPSLVNLLKNGHYSGAPAGMARLASSKMLDFVDPTETLLLQSEATRIGAELEASVKDLRRHGCVALDRLGDQILKKSEQDEKLASTVLGPNYQVDEKAALLTPAHRDRPKTESERRAMVTTLIHFQVAGLRAAGLGLEEAKEQVKKRYSLAVRRVKERRPTLPELLTEAVAQSLDPHSSYLSPRELEDFEINMQLSLEGIGAALRSENGFTIIESLIPGGKAHESGKLKSQDKIIAVKQKDGEPESIIDMDLNDVVRLIRGPSGTLVILTLLRDGKGKAFDVTLERGKIDLKSQAAQYKVEERIIGGKKFKLGVIELPSFYGGDGSGRSCSNDVAEHLEQATKDKVDGVLLDLSENGGGLLQEAVRVSGLFIRRGAIVAARDGRGETEVLADEDGSIAYSGPLVVLTSPVSASASEILAGALKGYQRAVIVGSARTFGKGTVQVVRPLGPLGAVKLTTSMFYLPNGVSTQRSGVPSDVLVPSLLEAYDIGEAELENPLPAARMNSFKSRTINSTSAESRWKSVSSKSVKELGGRSKKRIKGNKGFTELQAEVKRLRSNRRELRVADVLASGNDNESSEDADKWSILVRNEALDVLGDLVKILR